GWLSELAKHARRLPGQVGYGLIAWLVLNRGWFEWLGLTETDA
ncbi:MAG TPA: lysophospholipase, partial [Aquiluna sp.]